MVSDNWPGRSYGMKTVHIDQNIDLTNRYVEEQQMPMPIEAIENIEMTAPIRSWEEADNNLLKAADAVVNRRDEQYGLCYDHHAATAAMWSVYLGCTILPEQVSAMFVLDKIVRSKEEDKPDHWVDVAGYAQVHAKVQAEAERQNG